jgi:atypical dual specificity phosphatase
VSQPANYSWVDRPLLAASGRPRDADELSWLRQQGIQLLISLTEEPLRRDWVNEAGLMAIHIPVEDMEPPSPEQLDRALSAIGKAHEQNIAVNVHCGAGMGRTGVVLACYFVTKGMDAQGAINKVRRIRPGSIETDEQVDAVVAFARRHEKPAE